MAIRTSIKGYNGIVYTLDELIRQPQFKYPFGVPENSTCFYYQNMTPNELEGERFKTSFLYFKHPVEVSNLGRIRYKECILQQEDDITNHPNGGWLWLDCPEYKFLHHKYIYQLVTDTWIGKNPGTNGNWFHRHHINNNGYDNRPENLIWLSPEEHKLIPKPNCTKTLLYYNTNTSSFIESTQSVQMTEAWNRFTSKLAPSSLILDFGCGSGRDTKFFLEHGFKVEAMDGSEELCKAASIFTGFAVKHQLFQDWESESKYDGIWACSSILHLNKQELKQVIGNIRDALLPGGIFYTSFKYSNFEGVRNGRYFTDMTESSFAELINEVSGFEIIEKWITSDVRPGREEEKWLNVILKKI